jgi:molybdate transport system substrate-binding protein
LRCRVRGRGTARVAALTAALAVTSALLVGGCGSDESEELTVAAASSLRTALGTPEVAEATGARFTFAGSDLLASQIRQGADVDVIAAASTIQPDALHAEGLADRPVEFAGNRLVVGVPLDSKIESVEDLAAPGVSVVIGDDSVPVGIYGREMLDRLPGQTGPAIMDNVRSMEQDATSITAKITQGAADAGIVYATDVTSAAGDLRAVRIPEELQPRIAYSAAVVSATDMPAEAEALIESLVSGELATELRQSGLLPPP